MEQSETFLEEQYSESQLSVRKFLAWCQDGQDLLWLVVMLTETRWESFS